MERSRGGERRGGGRGGTRQREGASPSRQQTLAKAPDGFIFGCTNATEAECFDLNLFGLPANKLPEVEKVASGTAVFLFNYDERVLTGVFAAACQGASNLIPRAWGGKFPAQVRVVPPAFKRRIPESAFRRILKDNYFSRNRFTYNLEKDQVNDLYDLFDQSVPQVGYSRPPRYVMLTRDSVEVPLSESGKQQVVLGGGNTCSSVQSNWHQSGTDQGDTQSSGQSEGQQSGTAMDTNSYNVLAPQGMEATSNPHPAGFAPAQSSPLQFTVSNPHNVDQTSDRGGPVPGEAHPVPGSGDYGALADNYGGAWAGSNGGWGSNNRVWADHNEKQMPVRMGGNEKKKNAVQCGSDDHAVSKGSTLMDTSDCCVAAPQGMEATSTPTPAGFVLEHSSPHISNSKDIDETPYEGGPLTGSFNGSHPVPCADNNGAWAGNCNGAWAADSKMPIRSGEDEKMKNPVRFGSDDRLLHPTSSRVTSKGGGILMDFQSTGIGVGPSQVHHHQVQDNIPTHQSPAVDTASFGQHGVQFGQGGSSSTPPKRPKGKFDWNRLTFSSGAPFGDITSQENAHSDQAGFGDGVGEPKVTIRADLDVGVPTGQENIDPHSPSQSNGDPQLGFQNQNSGVPPQFDAEGLNRSIKSRPLGQSQQQEVLGLRHKREWRSVASLI